MLQVTFTAVFLIIAVASARTVHTFTPIHQLVSIHVWRALCLIVNNATLMDVTHVRTASMVLY